MPKKKASKLFWNQQLVTITGTCPENPSTYLVITTGNHMMFQGLALDTTLGTTFRKKVENFFEFLLKPGGTWNKNIGSYPDAVSPDQVFRRVGAEIYQPMDEFLTRSACKSSPVFF